MFVLFWLCVAQSLEFSVQALTVDGVLHGSRLGRLPLWRGLGRHPAATLSGRCVQPCCLTQRAADAAGVGTQI